MFLTILLSSFLTFVELNCENLFDTCHDVGKEDTEFLPDGSRHWTSTKYWGKLNRIGQEILSCSDELPDIVALVEVENDSVLRDLTCRSLLRNAGYHYLMTESPDVRGLDVALLYHPARFRPVCCDYLSLPPMKGMRPTRDILYVRGHNVNNDTLHIFVVHAPSRNGGELETRPYRLLVSQVIEQAIRQLSSTSQIIVVGDFNDYSNGPSLRPLYDLGLLNATEQSLGSHGARGTYRYQGDWRSIDHFLVSSNLSEKIHSSYINDASFLLEDDKTYGGKRPFRSFRGFRYQRGYSDHLPLVVRFLFD